MALLGQWHGLLLDCVAGQRGASCTEALPSWPGLASRSMVFILPVFRGGSCDLPACRGDSSRAVQFLVKEDKSQAEGREEAPVRQAPAACLFTVCCAPAEQHAQLSSQGLCSTVSPEAQAGGEPARRALRSGQDGGRAGRTQVQSFPVALKWSQPGAHLTSLVLVARTGKRRVRKGKRREVQGRREKNPLQGHHLPGSLL